MSIPRRTTGIIATIIVLIVAIGTVLIVSRPAYRYAARSER